MKKTIKNNVYKINGMDCPSCASLIQMEIEDIGLTCTCSFTKQTLEINSDHDPKLVLEIVNKLGYTIS